MLGLAGDWFKHLAYPKSISFKSCISPTRLRKTFCIVTSLWITGIGCECRNDNADNTAFAIVLDFESLRFLDNNSNIILIGNSGVGKTHLATSIGIAAAKKRVSTYFIKCQDLIEQLKKAYIENKLDDRIKHFSKYKILIIDEIGYLPIGEQEAKMFFQLIDRRYEKKSTIVTSNINLSDWNQIFLDNMLAIAILDRLVHHSTIVNILGNSYRTATALSKISDKNN